LHKLITIGGVKASLTKQIMEDTKFNAKKIAKEITEEVKEVFTYLNELRDSGVTNMFGATPYLVNEFGFDKRNASNYLILWMQSYKNEKDV
tara:strand:+ start:498 stop:770 length:273 start_codon:yes stop_codon:yes gene_type:complete